MQAYGKFVGTVLRGALPAAVAAAVLAVGCDHREDQVRSYSAPKDPAPATAPASTLPVDARPVGAQPEMPAAPSAQQSPLQWTLPSGWQLDPQPRAMRVATVFVESEGERGELIVTRFRAGGFGPLLDNLNRWRQQAGLQPVASENEITPEKASVGGAEAKVYDFTGSAGGEGNPAKRNRVVVVETAAGDAWFFRFFGPADLVDAQRPAFDALLQSVKFPS